MILVNLSTFELYFAKNQILCFSSSKSLPIPTMLNNNSSWINLKLLGWEREEWDKLFLDLFFMQNLKEVASWPTTSNLSCAVSNLMCTEDQKIFEAKLHQYHLDHSIVRVHVRIMQTSLLACAHVSTCNFDLRTEYNVTPAASITGAHLARYLPNMRPLLSLIAHIRNFIGSRSEERLE